MVATARPPDRVSYMIDIVRTMTAESTATLVRSRCALSAAGEPLAGTAPLARYWLCLQVTRAWPRDVSADHDPIIAEATRRATEAGWRPVFIRRAGRVEHDGPRARVYLVDTHPEHTRLTELDLAAPVEVAALDFAGLAAGRTPWPGRPHPDPLLLVCAHGRRDLCCAVGGRALVNALDDADPGLWICSHLGGHRFAPTAVVLPTGYLYGRLDVASARTALAAAHRGEMEPDRCRGRATWEPSCQAAELAVRERTGERSATALTAAAGAADAESGSVSYVTVSHTDGQRWRVRVDTVAGTARPASCGAEPEQATVLVATEVRELSTCAGG